MEKGLLARSRRKPKKWSFKKIEPWIQHLVGEQKENGDFIVPAEGKEQIGRAHV